MSTGLHIRTLASAELTCIGPLFERVFQQSISPALLDWKYADGRGESWVAAESPDGPPVIHCGLMFRDVLLGGQLHRAAQLVDLMADAKRAGLTRAASPFAQLMQALLASLPRSDNPAGMAFGFPSDRAMRLGEHAGVYLAIDRWDVLSLLASPAPAEGRLRPWEPNTARDRALADTLWQTMARDLQDYCVGCRDHAYLLHRYRHRPEKSYVLLVAESRWLRRPLGLVAMHLPEGAAHGEILDIVGPLANLPRILALLRQWLHTRQRASVSMMLTAHFAERFGALTDGRAASEFRIMANPHSPPELLERLRGRWWLTGGDTDYR